MIQTRQARRLAARLLKKAADRKPTGQHIARTIGTGDRVQEVPPDSPLPNRAARRANARQHQARQAAGVRFRCEGRVTEHYLSPAKVRAMEEGVDRMNRERLAAGDPVAP